MERHREDGATSRAGCPRRAPPDTPATSSRRAPGADEAAHDLGELGSGRGEHRVTATPERIELRPGDLFSGPTGRLNWVDAVDLAMYHEGGHPQRREQRADVAAWIIEREEGLEGRQRNLVPELGAALDELLEAGLPRRDLRNEDPHDGRPVLGSHRHGQPSEEFRVQAIGVG